MNFFKKKGSKKERISPSKILDAAIMPSNGFDSDKLYKIVKHSKKVSVSELVNDLEFDQREILTAIKILQQQGVISYKDGVVSLPEEKSTNPQIQFKKKNLIVYGTFLFLFIGVLSGVFFLDSIHISNISQTQATLSGGAITETEPEIEPVAEYYPCESVEEAYFASYCLNLTRVDMRKVDDSMLTITVTTNGEQDKLITVQDDGSITYT